MKTAGSCTTAAAAAAFSLLMLPAPSAVADSVRSGLVLPARGPVTRYVSGAAAIAIGRLKKPECATVLSDFRDSQGHSLKENLESLRMTEPEFFLSLRFVEGSHVALCNRAEVAAGTTPGRRVIAVCVATFDNLQREHPGLAADVLIHEMLHALGLGENPP